MRVFIGAVLAEGFGNRLCALTDSVLLELSLAAIDDECEQSKQNTPAEQDGKYWGYDPRIFF